MKTNPLQTPRFTIPKTGTSLAIRTAQRLGQARYLRRIGSLPPYLAQRPPVAMRQAADCAFAMELVRDSCFGRWSAHFWSSRCTGRPGGTVDRQSSPHPAQRFRRFSLWKYRFFEASADGVDAQVAEDADSGEWHAPDGTGPILSLRAEAVPVPNELLIHELPRAQDYPIAEMPYPQA